MDSSEFFAAVVFRLGPVTITDTVVTTWAIMAILWLTCWWRARRLRPVPGKLQTVAEAIVAIVEDAVKQLLPDNYREVTPFVMALWVFLVCANLTGLIPGLHSPTRDFSLTAGLAVTVFFSVHWFGIKNQGLVRYLKHYLVPSPLLLPFHIVSEITRTIALAVRLFGNMMSLEMVALLLLVVAGFLVPVPILMLHIVEGLVQAYIFGMLALAYIAGALQSQRQAGAEPGVDTLKEE